MDEELRAQARRIIRAQASTELGSIQQHEESLQKAQDPKAQFDVLRIMAEEYRHGYQMFYLLASADWLDPEGAEGAVEEVLGMRTGTHVLDAFNVYFDSFVDNIVFAAVIDRVGKYQLTMQKVFAYAPMARAMGPMLTEEAFHLATGVNTLKRWVRDAALDQGNISLRVIQQHLNKWIPRGLEMFGDDRGGAKNVEMGLKSMANRVAVSKYHAELGDEVVDVLNREIVRARVPGAAGPAIEDTLKVIHEGGTLNGLRREDLLHLPDARFFRRRGEHAFERVGRGGESFPDPESYLRHLRAELPDAYVAGRDFSAYLGNLAKAQEGRPVEEPNLPFYG
jgi:1,2-phenylacetyl-CoA epoxidase catalytic subunit